MAPDPDNGFTQAFQARFHELPTPYAANLYDSLLMVAYGLVRSHGKAGAALATAIHAVVDGTGPTVGWDGSGVAQALAAIRAGKPPEVMGAVGRWEFDKTSGMDLVASTYEHWRVEGTQFAVASYLSTATSPTAQRGSRS